MSDTEAHGLLLRLWTVVPMLPSARAPCWSQQEREARSRGAEAVFCMKDAAFPPVHLHSLSPRSVPVSLTNTAETSHNVHKFYRSCGKPTDPGLRPPPLS